MSLELERFVVGTMKLKLEEWRRRRGPPSAAALAEVERLRRRILRRRFGHPSEVEAWIARACEAYMRKSTIDNVRDHMCAAWILREIAEDLAAAILLEQAHTRPSASPSARQTSSTRSGESLPPSCSRT